VFWTRNPKPTTRNCPLTFVLSPTGGEGRGEGETAGGEGDGAVVRMAERLRNPVQNALEIRDYLIIPKTKHPKPPSSQKLGPLLIFL